MMYLEVTRTKRNATHIKHGGVYEIYQHRRERIGGDEMKAKDIPEFDPEKDNTPLNPANSRMKAITDQFTWIRYVIEDIEARFSAKTTGLWVIVIILCFAVGFLFAKTL